MIYGHARITITSWLSDNATESLDHAQEAGEMIMRGVVRLTCVGQHELEAEFTFMLRQLPKGIPRSTLFALPQR